MFKGIKGWVPLSAPHRKHKRKNQQGPGCDADEFENRCGGLELLLRFGKESDRELVINTARGIGWSPLESLETHEDSFATDAVVLTLNAVISVDKIWLTKEIVMNFAEDSLSNFQIYCRYKFYQTGWYGIHYTALHYNTHYTLQIILQYLCPACPTVYYSALHQHIANQ